MKPLEKDFYYLQLIWYSGLKTIQEEPTIPNGIKKGTERTRHLEKIQNKHPFPTS